jgi:PAS domain S-box-containing protein
MTHPEDLQENLRLIKDMLAGKCQQIAIVKRYLRKGGSVRLVQMMVNLLPNDHGAPQYLLSTFLDITDLRRAEEAVQESEARLRAIFEHAPVGITMVEATGRFLQTNPAYQAIVGYNATELQGMTWQQITHPEYLPENERLHKELLAGQRQSYQIEKRYLRKDGEIVWVSVMLSSLHNAQGELRLVATIIDITARKQAEEALRKSEQRFRDITENTSEWIWEVDAEGKYTYSSPMVKHLLGYEPEEFSIIIL